MPLVNRIANFHAEMTEWRHAMHAHPETAFEEVWTSDFVANKVSEFGYTVHRGLAGTGVVGTIKGNKPDTGRAIGLRADMDALPIQELDRGQPYRSMVDGRQRIRGGIELASARAPRGGRRGCAHWPAL